MSAHFKPDKDLLERALARDPQAVSELVKQSMPCVFRLAFRMSKSRDIAEEATQDCFVAVLKNLSQLRNPERYPSWLLTIAANCTRALLKNRPTEVELLREPTARATQTETQDQKTQAIEQAISQLPMKDRSLFLLHSVEGVRLKELARQEQTTESAMKAKVHRIRARLRVLAHKVLSKGSQS